MLCAVDKAITDHGEEVIVQAAQFCEAEQPSFAVFDIPLGTKDMKERRCHHSPEQCEESPSGTVWPHDKQRGADRKGSNVEPRVNDRVV